MGSVTPEQLLQTVAVVLVIFGAIVTIDKVIDIVKKWRSPTTDAERKLAADKERLDQHDKEIEGLKEGNQVICSALLALLDHELHNGNGEQMQQARDDMMRYLQGLITR